nr:hypothetical protein [Amazonocrinis nigriterrae]
MALSAFYQPHVCELSTRSHRKLSPRLNPQLHEQLYPLELLAVLPIACLIDVTTWSDPALLAQSP